MNDQFVGQTLAGKYRIDSESRRSGSGKVYRGTHLLIDTPVTVKILAPALAADKNVAKEFSGEARAVSRISHPNILNVTDFGTDASGAVYIVSEGASGETLREALNRDGSFSLERAAQIARQIAAAHAAAHAAGISHQRLNPENVLLAQTAGDTETVKILDFGTARADNRTIADGGFDSGNSAYLAPEQNAALDSADERSDIYALGVIVYEMLAGEVPFAAESSADSTFRQAENPPPPLASFRRDLPETIELVVLKALANNPEMRYQTASEFAADLNRAANDPIGAETIIVPHAADLPVHQNNNLWKTAFVVLAGISLLAIGMIYATSVKQTDVPTTLGIDANGQPVQPLNPATGTSEQSLANMSPYQMPQQMGNVNGVMMMMPQQLPDVAGGVAPSVGGDGYGDGRNFWSGEGPPRGAPPSAYVGQGGQIITIPGEGGGSQFMPNEDGTAWVAVPIPNANANLQPTPTPKGGKTPTPTTANTQSAPTPAVQTPAKTEPTPAPKTEKPPAEKPAAAPKTAPPASGETRPPSGVENEKQ